MTWLEWLVAGAPWSIAMSAVLYFAVLRVLPPESDQIEGGAEAVRAKLASLGPMTSAQARLGAATLVLLAFWSTEKVLHTFDTTTTTIAVLSPLFLPGIGIMKWKDVQSRIPLGTLIVFGVGISLGTALLDTKAGAWLAEIGVREYVQTRAKWEPLAEVTQMKGTGESHPFLSPNDEFADFELWDKANLDFSVPKQKEMLQYEYARAALKNGLKLEQLFGTNPYKFGMIGSTDAHTALSTAEENNFFGKVTMGEPSAERLQSYFIESKQVKSGLSVADWEVSASGRAAVRARENTRESIWDAMARKEVYATTGTWIVVRFFGGWDFQAKDALDRMPARIGYDKGAPWGATCAGLPPARCRLSSWPR